MFGFGGGVTFNPEKDIPDLNGRVYLVTGGNSGLGRETILQLSKHNPAQIYCGARNAKSAEEAIAAIKKAVPAANIQFLELDLADFASIKAASDAFTKSSQRLDCLINNGGVMALPPGLTKDGYEIQFGTNHMGHALLTKLLLPTLQQTAKSFPDSDVSIVNLSSAGNDQAPKQGLILQEARTNMGNISTIQRYGQSKLANILHAKELARRYPELRVVAVHPGVVKTNLMNGLIEHRPWVKYVAMLTTPFLMTPENGALNQLWASVSKDDAKTGKFYYPIGKPMPGNLAEQHEVLQRELWEFTEKEFASKGY